MQQIKEVTVNLAKEIVQTTLNYSLGFMERDKALKLLCDYRMLINKCLNVISGHELIILLGHYNLLCEWLQAPDFTIEPDQNTLTVINNKLDQDNLERIYNNTSSNKQRSFYFCTGNDKYKTHVITAKLEPDMPYVELPIEYLDSAKKNPEEFSKYLDDIPVISEKK